MLKRLTRQQWHFSLFATELFPVCPESRDISQFSLFPPSTLLSARWLKPRHLHSTASLSWTQALWPIKVELSRSSAPCQSVIHHKYVRGGGGKCVAVEIACPWMPLAGWMSAWRDGPYFLECLVWCQMVPMCTDSFKKQCVCQRVQSSSMQGLAVGPDTLCTFCENR